MAVNITGKKDLACDLVSETLLYLTEKQQKPQIINLVGYFISTMKLLSLPNGAFTEFRNYLNSGHVIGCDNIPQEEPKEPSKVTLTCLNPHEVILIELCAEGYTAARIARELQHDGVTIHPKLVSNMIEKARKKARLCNKY